MLDEGGYRLRDTKLARSVKVEALLQLAAYAEALGRRGPVAPDVELASATDTVMSYRSVSCPGVPAAPPDCNGCWTNITPAGSAVRWEDESRCGRASAARNAPVEVASPQRRAAGRGHAGHPARPADRRRRHHGARAGASTTGRSPGCPHTSAR